MREKLIELLNNSFESQYEKRGLLTAQHTATDLIANGVTMEAYDCHWATETAYKNGYKQGIKDFVQRLKEYKLLSSDWSHGEHPYVVEEDDIDDLSEEMVGDMDG